MCLPSLVLSRLHGWNANDPDISLGQWLGSTPRQIVADTLSLDDETLDKLKSEKQYVVAGQS